MITPTPPLKEWRILLYITKMSSVWGFSHRSIWRVMVHQGVGSGGPFSQKETVESSGRVFFSMCKAPASALCGAKQVSLPSGLPVLLCTQGHAAFPWVALVSSDANAFIRVWKQPRGSSIFMDHRSFKQKKTKKQFIKLLSSWSHSLIFISLWP